MEFDLKSGTVTLMVVEGKMPDLSRIRKEVKKAGFTTRDIYITAIGTLDIQEEKVLLNVRNSDHKYLLFEKQQKTEDVPSKERRTNLADLANRGALVSVTGTVFENREDLSRLLIDKVEPLQN